MSPKPINVAIAGATGAVGQALLEILEERDFPVERLFLLASERSEGKTYRFRGKTLKVERLDAFDFEQVQIGLFSAGGTILRGVCTQGRGGWLRGHRQHLPVSR